MGMPINGISVTLRPKEYCNLQEPDIQNRILAIEEYLNSHTINYTVVYSRFRHSCRIHINETNFEKLSKEQLDRLKQYGFYRECGHLWRSASSSQKRHRR